MKCSGASRRVRNLQTLNATKKQILAAQIAHHNIHQSPNRLTVPSLKWLLSSQVHSPGMSVPRRYTDFVWLHDSLGVHQLMPIQLLLAKNTCVCSSIHKRITVYLATYGDDEYLSVTHATAQGTKPGVVIPPLPSKNFTSTRPLAAHCLADIKHAPTPP